MQTRVPDSLKPGLTDQQLECLWFLRDGSWHDHKDIGRHIKNFIPSNLTGRTIRPLENRGFIEQEVRPVKDGSRKMKNFVRIKKDLGGQMLHDLHLLIVYSANDLVMRYKGKNTERAKFFNAIRKESIKKCNELEKLEKEIKQNAEREYWEEKESEVPNSESWRDLIRLSKHIAEIIEQHCKPDVSIPILAFGIACEARQDLCTTATLEDAADGGVKLESTRRP
jgi:hypothetical protein